LEINYIGNLVHPDIHIKYPEEVHKLLVVADKEVVMFEIVDPDKLPVEAVDNILVEVVEVADKLHEVVDFGEDIEDAEEAEEAAEYTEEADRILVEAAEYTEEADRILVEAVEYIEDSNSFVYIILYYKSLYKYNFIIIFITNSF
jgi:hypothetical protein